MKIIQFLAKTRLRRLLFSLLAPPFSGVLAMLLADAIRAGNFSIQLPLIFAIILGGYTFMGLQSLVAGLIMEFVVLKYAVAQYQILLAGALLGALAGATLYTLTPALIFIGLCVGLLMGMVFRLVHIDHTPG